MFEKILSMYGLKSVKHFKKDTAAMLLEIPKLATLHAKKQFMVRMKTEFPELYERAWHATKCGVVDFATQFKKKGFRYKNWSLQSTFALKGNPIRLYWKLSI